MGRLKIHATIFALTIVVGACGSADSLLNNVPDGGSLDQGDAGVDGRGDASASSDAGKDHEAPPAETFSVGGSVSGLLGTGLVLQVNAGDDLPVAADGTFTFPKKLPAGSAYDVTIKTQPTAPSQTCSISGGSGTIANGNVTSITVNCATEAFTVGGTVTGLVGSGLIVQNQGGDDLVINANGSFAFATPVASGAAYAITVKVQPDTPSQTCVVTNDAGTIAAANVTNVAIACTTNEYKVGGTVAGLSGAGLVLQINGGETLPIAASGPFSFPTSIASGAAFDVTVSAQPTGPMQTCTVAGGSGTVGAGDVGSITVNCATNKYAIGGAASGLSGTGLVLQNNGGDDLPVTANGQFAFATPIDDQAAYAASIKTQPTSPSQTCVLTNASGNVAAADVTNIGLACTTNEYKVSATVTGLAGSGLVLQNNAGDDLPVGADGTFTFASKVASGKTYAVTVKTQPTNLSQSCTVTNGTGEIGGADVTNVQIACVTNTFTVGGTAAGLAGSGLVLQNNAGDDLPVAASGAFTFAQKITSGGTYAVTIKSQPSNPTQTCTVSAGSGTVTNGNVVTVAVNCTTNKYTIGGTSSGVVGTGLVLQNNAGNDLTINGNGSFAFGTPIESGKPYAVTVKTQPTNPSQTCSVTAGSGTVTNANVANVAVSCVTNKYAVGGTLTGITGATIVLQNNGGDALTLNANGAFSFSTPIASGATYAVTIGTPPVNKFCTIANGSGTVGSAAITNVAVQCVDASGTVRDVSGQTKPVLFLPCGDGTNTNCTQTVAENTCKAVGRKLVSHASNGSDGVVSLGATNSCQWSISYFTTLAAPAAGSCLIGISNATWSNCCSTSYWHGNIVTMPTTSGAQFGYVYNGNSGYDPAMSNVSGTTWGCVPNTSPPPSQGGCTTYQIACQ